MKVEEKIKPDLKHDKSNDQSQKDTDVAKIIQMKRLK